MKLSTDLSEKRKGKVLIQDNGRGIAKEDLEKLIEKGFSKGKENGTGLGLFHAHQQIQKWGGDLEIQSTPGEGTTVTLVLPRMSAPKWFLSSLKFNDAAEVVIMDDDDSVHQLWKSVLSPWRNEVKDLTFHHFYTTESFEGWIQEKEDRSRLTFLMDYEVLGSEKTGLEVIETHQLQKQAVLVTSHYEDPDIRTRCSKIGLKLLPKGVSMFVPVIPMGETPKQDKIDMVLIDDDLLIRKVWQVKAKEAGFNLSSFSSIAEFENFDQTLPKDIPIYLDSDLGGEIRGEDYAKTLFENGLPTTLSCYWI